jgi:glutaminyl-tRNA synthetase
MYDYAHGQSDSIERITHSICTLEYADHRPLYDWYLEQLGIYHPQQIEFARLNLTYTVMSKRKLLRLVQDKHVRGWDDPRMPTISAMRRRGYPATAIRDFCNRVGVSKINNMMAEIQLLEACVRQDLNSHAQRVMAVLKPLKVVLTNYPEDQVEEMTAINNPEDESMGTRKVPFSRVLYIEQDDFMENPPKNYFRLAPGREVRLRYAYFIKCEEVIKDAHGNVIELRCTYDPATRGGDAPDGRKVKATLHWVSAPHALDAEVRLYNYLFTEPYPENTEEGQDFIVNLNPNSLEVLQSGKIEPSVKGAASASRYQFERQGYFAVDPDSSAEKLVFNRAVSLKDTWAKVQQKA